VCKGKVVGSRETNRHSPNYSSKSADPSSNIEPGTFTSDNSTPLPVISPCYLSVNCDEHLEPLPPNLNTATTIVASTATVVEVEAEPNSISYHHPGQGEGTILVDINRRSNNEFNVMCA